jgi:hypothetical protein
MTPQTRKESPWPGPRPYGIEDGEYFFGRDREVEEIRRRVLNEHFTILSGSSGTGKTSVLRAGVVWSLLRSRELGRQDNNRLPIWPVLVLSDWGSTTDITVDRLLRERLKDAVQSLSQWAPDDYAQLSPVLASQAESEGQDFCSDIAALCEKAGSGLILILDQFEEVLRAGEEFADDAIRIVSNLYRFERRVKLMVSLRDEYHKYLHGLETYVGGLGGRTYFLKPMIAQTVRDAILQSAQAARISISEPVVDEIIMWLRRSSITWLQSQRSFSTTSQEGGDEDASVDLLTLQAILRELFEFCSKRSDGNTVVIDRAELDSYAEGHSTEELVGEALERWIRNALLAPAVPANESIPEIYKLPELKLTGFVRRVAARMAPYLSSGGYKVPAEERAVMYGTLRDDFARLSDRFEDNARTAWGFQLEGTIPRLDRSALGLSAEYNEITSFNLSGVAREQRWSPAETAEQLVAVYLEVLRRLQKGNILKPIRHKNDIVWELVHDKLGDPLSHWADAQRDTWENAVYSLTATRGTDLLLVKSQQRESAVNNMCWQGCWVIPRDGSILDGFVFKDCNLQGTVFFNCTLKGVTFHNCLLDGVLFINCQFECGDDDRPVVFQNCEGNGMGFIINGRPGAKSVVHGMSLEGCKFSQVKMSRLQLSGAITVESGTRLYLCDFAGLESGATNAPVSKVRFLDGSTVEFCAWDKASKRLISIEDGCNLLSSGLRGDQM